MIESVVCDRVCCLGRVTRVEEMSDEHLLWLEDCAPNPCLPQPLFRRLTLLQRPRAFSFMEKTQFLQKLR